MPCGVASSHGSQGALTHQAGAVPFPGEDPCTKPELEDYNLGLHIGSVFILLGVSLLGSLLHVVLRITSQHAIMQTLIRCVDCNLSGF